MEDKISLDTDVLADFLRNKEYAINWFNENKDKKLFTTSINMFELYYGAYKFYEPKKALDPIKKLKKSLSILNLTDKSANIAAKKLVELEKQGNAIDLKDLLIASIILNEGFNLKTNNKKHFERIKELNLV